MGSHRSFVDHCSHAVPILIGRRQTLRLGVLGLASVGLTSASWRAFTPSAGAIGIGGLLPGASRQQIWRDGFPFSLGVAAGSLRADGFTLWTRLAPRPLLVEGDPSQQNDFGLAGMAPNRRHAAQDDIVLGVEVADDPAMRWIVHRGVAIAEAGYGYSVHVDIDGLQPARPYWFRFHSGDAVSPIGRARTLAAAGQAQSTLKIGVASCSNYERGYFSAYRHLAAETPDLVLFLGDYIYEKSHRENVVRAHSDGVTAQTLAQYRRRHAQYRLDPDLQQLHATAPCLVTWDDHEVQNDYAGDWSETFDKPVQFLRRRTAAYQAYYEHMPLSPKRSKPQGPNMRIYDKVTFGDLAQIHLLDGRQYRDREACYSAPDHGDGHLETRRSCAELTAGNRSMLGENQEAWLYQGLAKSTAKWNIIAQDVLMAPLRERQPAPEHDFGYATDRWDGYPTNRARLLQHLSDTKTSNPVVLSGDIHAFFANDLHLNPDDTSSTVIAHELVGTSITSPGPSHEALMHSMVENPHIRFCDSRQRGYMMVDIDGDKLTTHFRTVSDVTDPHATRATLRSFVIASGEQKLQNA